ncbi:MAG: DUF11 domain-containing protein, partial [Propionibacteriaceae bacterium]|nr:DUF11 domain-containing protein [Propionibacteriaceae bacterium]
LDGGTEIINSALVNDGFHAVSFWTNEATTDVVAEPVLTSSTKLVDKTDAAPGEMLRYTLRLVNEGKMNAQAVNVFDELPDEVIHVGGPYEGGTYNPVLHAIIWNGNLNAGSVFTLTYDVVVDSPMDDGTVIENTADMNYGGLLTLGPISTTVHSAPDLTNSTKEVDRVLATAG